MNDPEPPDEKPVADLLATTDRDAAMPDRAFLDRLRDQSAEAFQAAAPLSFRKRIMLRSSFRWVAATAAAVMVLGIVVAQWVKITNPVVAPAPDDKFVAENGLVDDGRIGKVTDAQGVVAVKPVLAERWSPVQPRLVLKPGDWLRTDSRGANAVAVKLLKSVAAIVGPHSTVELVKATEIRLLAGELELTATEADPVELHGPDKQTVKVTGKSHFRVEKDKLVKVEQEPLWLQGFKGTTANESIGSLVASIDGRDVPLTVGYHHVTVDIRDQIARTTIEESFVNRTKSVLEGVFHFPLPQDASISGFGMWIGDQLVEADVVEKQRAREIYETILREKRDPGLLEWAGGNIFKARVYPINPHSEKRIKITYTQVLPLQGNRFRYSYALQSELLKAHPLRDLKIDVKVNSAVPLKAVSSPTHPVRVTKTDHSGHVEFTAQEYTPTRDFEAVVEVAGRQSDVVMIPHRRGDDGYFLVQLTPPGAGGDWERPLVPNGDPLKLLILADTSASMDRQQRTSQRAVIVALLGSLTPKDTVNVAACDVGCDWAFEKPSPATPENLAVIDQLLTKRSSLGWTDLDKVFASALTMCEPGTHVVYVGDGIVTTGDADPVAFAKRVQALHKGKAGTFHAVAVGSSFEPLALKAIASLGGGSFRRVSGEKGPQAAALELLTEIAAPTLRDVKVEFVGLQTARVYPESLPNVAAGTQQILLGRYLPAGKDQAGEVIVTGTLGGKPVRFASKVSLADAEAGNSFIPRLWARMHLDKLLEQGTSDVVKQDIIGLSEEFNIITPYTSLLVLETDADRERFAVKRRFQMRDGERFFATGRDNATYELKQRQMTRAGSYRTELRRSVLAHLATLGRNAQLFSPRRGDYAKDSVGGRGGRGYLNRLSLGDDVLIDDLTRSEDEFYTSPRGAVASGRILHGLATGVGVGDGDGDELNKSLADGMKAESEVAFDQPANGPLSGEALAIDNRRGLADSRGTDGTVFWDNEFDFNGRFGTMLGRQPGKPMYDSGGRGQQPRLLWLGTLFPSLAGPPAAPKEPKSAWPANALALSRSLLRTEALGRIKGGVVIARQSDSYDARRNELSARSRRLELVSPTAWFARTSPEGGQVLASWCDGKEAGAFTTAFQLGRVRPSTARDLQQPPLELADHSTAALHVAFAKSTASVEVIDKDRSLLILKHRGGPDLEVRYLIDTTRRVLLSIEHRFKGKVTAATRFDDFVEVAGSWWARHTETLNDKGERTSLTTQTVAEVPADEFANKMADELAGKAKVLFLGPLPKLADAKAAVVAGKATFDDRATLTLHFAATQQWGRAREHLEAAEKLAAGKPGMRWLSSAFLLAGRRHEELRKRLLEDATAHANTADADALANDHFLAEYLFGQAHQVCQANEQIVIADALRKSADRQPAHLHAVKSWRNWRVSLLQQAGQPDKARAVLKELATAYPHDTALQHNYVQQLAGTGDFPAAYEWLTRVLEVKRDRAEVASLRDVFAGFLQQQGRYRELADYLAESIKIDMESEHANAFYLSSLVRSNQAARAETLTAEWIAAAVAAGELTPALTARLNAAVHFALGDVYGLTANRVEEKWHAPLAAAALHFARRGDTLATAGMIITHHRYSTTDAAQTTRKTLGELAVKDVATLSAAQLEQFVLWSFNSIEGPEREKLVAGLRKRWDAETNPDTKHRLGQPLGRLLYHLDDKDNLAFLRVQYATAADDYRVTYANQLFGALQSPWDAAREDEAFAMLDKLADADDVGAAMLNRVAALHRFTDAMLEARYQVRVKTIEHPEKLPRPELHKKHDDLRKQVREAFADRLRAEAAKHAKPFAAWLTAERIWIEMLLERDPKPVAIDCWALLDVPAPKADDALDAALRVRILTTLENLAARKGADAALVDRVLKHIDTQKERGEKYRLLIALDRPADLERELRQWLTGPDPENRWRLALGYLLAEQGKVVDAIKEFEQVEAADELTPAAYRSLTDWYLVENRREAHEKAHAAAFKTASEDQLGQRINVFLNPWRSTSGRLPTQLDPEVLLTFQVLFEKSATPQYYLGQLQQFYQASRDFRLLSMLPDGVIGHTAGKVYPFVQGMSGVVGEIRDEATADELLKRVEAVRLTAKTVIDQRALDMLELLVESRAAELKNQPGPHAAKALAAMQRAFQREWSPGELRLMADFLAGIGSMSQPALAAEQLKQLEALHRDAAAGSFDRLHIAVNLADMLGRYSRRQDATDRLVAALNEFETANGGRLPVSANAALDRLVSFTEGVGHYTQGEKVLLAQLTHPIHLEQKHWLDRRLYTLYQGALGGGGEVSLGKGAVLYKALEKKLYDDLATPDQNQRHQVVESLCGVYRTVHDRKIADAVGDVKAFAFMKFPPIVREQVNHYDAAVRGVADTVRFVCGPRDAIVFVLDRADTEPDWRRYAGQDAWTQFHTQLGEWRTQAKELGGSEPRLLKFVITELKRDLVVRQSHGRTLYSRQHNYFWPEKEAAFAAAAEEVLAERKTSSSAVEYVAQYLFHGLPRETRAIEVLFAAHEQKVLSDDARWHLTGYMHQKGRFAESIPLLVPLVEKRPENLDYRRRLMHAYFQTGKPAELLALLKGTDAYFHDKDRWDVVPLAVLAASTLENKLFAQSVAYHEELIPLHQRAHPRRGGGNGELSNYYSQAARAYSGLGNTKKAVDMAGGAVVSWGPTHGQRGAALDALVEVLAAAPDLPAFATDLDKEKLQSAVVRKAVGKAFIKKMDHARAIPHLLLAADLQPDDADTRRLLLECFDKVGDGEKAIAQLLSAVETSPRDIQLFAALGSRYAAINRPGDAERAYTSIVDMLPNETESHTLLAEVREKQGRWRDAIAHWERVAALRSLEPTGLLKLGAAQVSAKDWDAAAATLKKLRGQSWPPRFNDVQQQTRELEKKLDARPKK